MNEMPRIISKESKFRKINGITLISLVITIIILIILASVSIYLSLGNNGIFTRAKQAKEVTNKQTATDIINLKITTAQMNKYADEQRMPTLKELSEVLRYDNDIKYVTETSQIASENKKYEVGENPSSIFTKLDKYPSYEFEINGQLQLASINGIKIAQNETVASKRTKLLKEPVNTNTKNTDNNMDITLEDSIEQYTYLEIQVDMNGAQNGYFGETTFIIATEQLEYNDNDTMNFNNESLFIIRCYGSGPLETFIHCWFKNNNTLHIGNGYSEFSNINTMRIRNIYGIK